METGLETSQVIQKLIAAITNQKLSPDILPYQLELVQHLNSKRVEQQERLQMYEKDQNIPIAEKNFKLTIYKLQISRILYIIKSYMRCRLNKIQEYCFHIIQQDVLSLLSEEQKQFVVGFAKLRYDLYDQMVMKDLHKDFKGLGGIQHLFNQNEGKQNTKKFGSQQATVNHQKPKKEDYVFFKILNNPDEVRYQVDIKVNNLEQNQKDIISVGDVILMPYNEGQRFYKNGNAVLF